MIMLSQLNRWNSESELRTPPTHKTILKQNCKKNQISKNRMSDDKNLGWALKNGDLDRVKEQIEADVSH